jgi:lysyl-tRNA synthetase, class II
VATKITNQAKLKELGKMRTVGEVTAFAFEELVEEKLIKPTIIYDYPVEVSPLAKKTSDPKFTERFEGFVLGLEVGNNYSELNDPADLAQRFVAEKKKAEAGFAEAHQTDTDYLEAIEHGLPPACGFGIGVDRMVMLLTGAENIKEVILFPTLRPKAK